MTALIVDDDKQMRLLIRALLEAEGIECHEAEDGFKALTAARTIHPDVVMLDVMLPGLDGYKVSRMLKFDENFADIKIIMVTSRERPADKETGYSTGADRYVTKPFKPQELIRVIREVTGTGIAGR